MAEKKTIKKKKPPGKVQKKQTLALSLLKVFAGIVILIVLVVGTGFLTHYLLMPEPAIKRLDNNRVVSRNKKMERKSYGTATPGLKTPSFEIFSKEDRSGQGRKAVQNKVQYKGRPRVAIIIDDLGHDRFIAEKFLNLDAPLTFSLLPFGPHSKKIAKMADLKGREIMLHLPMEPVEYPEANPGRGALLFSMDPDQLIKQLRTDLSIISLIKGVNNHMGSKITADSVRMNQIFTILKMQNLFFIDSRSTAESVCRSSARLLKVPFAERDVFLDNIQDSESIRKQIEKLTDIAKKHGEAIGIAHPYSITYNILLKELPALEKKVVIVPASQLVRIIS